MFIFRQSMKKMLTSWSTWIILGVAVLLVSIIISTYTHNLIHKTINTQRIWTGRQIEIKAFWMVVSFISIFASIFTGFKSVQLIRSEIEDGTLLLILSKPIPRHILILQKWLSIIVINLIFSFVIFLVLFLYFAIVPLTFPTVLRTFTLGSYTKISFAFWGLLFLLMMLFSGSAILFSMFFSSTITIGASIATSILIPILAIISAFSISKNYKELITQHNKPLHDYIGAELLRNSLDDLNILDKDSLNNEIKSELKTHLDSIINFHSKIEEIYSNANVGELGLYKKSNSFRNSWFINPQEIIFTMFYSAIQPVEDITGKLDNFKNLFINPGEPQVTMQWVRDGKSIFNNKVSEEKKKLFYQEYLRNKDLNSDFSVPYIKLFFTMNKYLSEKVLEAQANGNKRIIIDSDFKVPEREISNYYPISGHRILSISQNGFSINGKYIYYAKNQDLNYDLIQPEKTYFIKKQYMNSLFIAASSIKSEHSRKLSKQIVKDLGLQINPKLNNFLNLKDTDINANIIEHEEVPAYLAKQVMRLVENTRGKFTIMVHNEAQNINSQKGETQNGN